MMNDFNLLTIIILFFLLLFVIVIIVNVANKKNKSNDKAFYNLDNDKEYRNGIYRQISVDFKPYLQQLYKSLDDLSTKISRASSEVSQAQYNAMCDIFRTAERLGSQIDEYWNSSKFKKDFSYYIGLHYASHLLANSLKKEQQNIKEAFVECKRRQDALTRQIDTAKRQQEKYRGEQRYRISKEIGELCKYHKSISIWKGYIGSLNTRYNQRVTDQNIKTAKYRDYIANNFGSRGQNWKSRCHQRALARK